MENVVLIGILKSHSHKFPSFFVKDGELIQRALSFYRLMVVWLVGMVGGFMMPLSKDCPMEFACMPEHFVEDTMELLIFASSIPKALDGFMLVLYNSVASY